MRRPLSNALLFMGSLLFFFLICELVFKLIAWAQPNQSGPSLIEGLPYENVSGSKFWRWDKGVGLHYYAHNSFGMRGPETTLEKPSGTIRIALLGDSVAHGGNVGQEETTPVILESLLRASGEKVEVLNFSVASYALREYAIVAEKKAANFSPDLFLVGLCVNDYYIRTRTDLERAEKKTRSNWFEERLQNLFRSHFLKFLNESINFERIWAMFARPAGGSGSLRLLQEADFISDADKEALLRFEGQNSIPMPLMLDWIKEYVDRGRWFENEVYIQDIIETGKKAGAQVVFFKYPTSEQVEPGYQKREPSNYVQEMVEKNGGLYVEMLDVFREYRRLHSGERVFPPFDNLHMLKNGHRLAAEKLAESLVLP